MLSQNRRLAPESNSATETALAAARAATFRRPGHLLLLPMTMLEGLLTPNLLLHRSLQAGAGLTPPGGLQTKKAERLAPFRFSGNASD